MTIEKPPVEDVVPIKTRDFPASHVSFHGCVTTIMNGEFPWTCCFLVLDLNLEVQTCWNGAWEVGVNQSVGLQQKKDLLTQMVRIPPLFLETPIWVDEFNLFMEIMGP